MKFSEYVNLLRIQHAEHDLRYSDESVTDIALNHGFANAATFNKYFRTTHGCSPKEYRKNSQLISLQDKETPQINERNVYLNTDIEKEERNGCHPKKLGHAICKIVACKNPPFRTKVGPWIQVTFAKSKKWLPDVVMQYALRIFYAIQ